MTLPAHSSPPTCPHLLAGRDALERGAWNEARTEFQRSLADTESPEAHEGLAIAAVGVSDVDGAIAAHERAFAVWRERGDRRAAARMALALMWDARALRGDPVYADGWLERARELLDGLGPVPERGWLLLRDADARVMPAQDFAGVRAMMSEAREIARAHGDVSLEMEVVALDGAALLRSGEVTEGLRRLDQAAAAAAAGEVENYISTGAILCQVLSAYEKVRDFDRAAKWAENLQAHTARRHSRPLGSLCRSYFAGLLVARGRWTEAEAALALGTRPVPWVGTRSLVRLGELRLKQGRYDEAEALFQRVAHQPDAQVGQAAIALERGDARTAMDLLERHCRQIPVGQRLERASGLALAVRAHAALGEFEAAAATAADLASLAAGVGTPGLVATARQAAGDLAIALGDQEAARLALEDAVDGWSRAGLPFERAAARLQLAGVLARLGREAPARGEAERAREEFDELGARAAAAEARALLERLAPAPGDGTACRPPLSTRELEVLGLVAQGLSNKEVAARLFLSEHTIKRHVANILTRLELPSRAAAVAWAARNELL